MSPMRAKRERAQHPKRDLVVAILAVAVGAAVLLLGNGRLGAVLIGAAVGAVVGGLLQAIRSLRALSAGRP
jgi:hypothetical protein